MNENLEELACLYVLDHLEPRERSAFEARLLRDPALAALVRELETALAHRVRALPPTPPPPDLLARIESRLDAAPTPAPDDATATTRLPSFLSQLLSPAGFAGLLRWGLAAVIAISLATLAVQSLRRPAAPQLVFVALDAGRSTLAELPLQTSAVDADARFVQLAGLAEKFWHQPDQLPVKNSSRDAGRRAYTLFDPTSRQGFIAVEQLPALAAGQRYHLWIVDTATGALHDAGALPLAEATRGLYAFSLGAAATTPPPRPDFFLTVEDTARQPAGPHGPVVLGDRRI